MGFVINKENCDAIPTNYMTKDIETGIKCSKRLDFDAIEAAKSQPPEPGTSKTTNNLPKSLTVLVTFLSIVHIIFKF